LRDLEKRKSIKVNDLQRVWESSGTARDGPWMRFDTFFVFSVNHYCSFERKIRHSILLSSEDSFAINCSASCIIFSKINLPWGGVPYRFAVQCVHQASDALTCGQTLLHIMSVSPYLFISLCLPDLVRNHAMQHNARLASFHVLQNPTGPQVWTDRGLGPGRWNRKSKKSSELSATSRRRLRCQSIRCHHSQAVSGWHGTTYALIFLGTRWNRWNYRPSSRHQWKASTKGGTVAPTRIRKVPKQLAIWKLPAVCGGQIRADPTDLTTQQSFFDSWQEHLKCELGNRQANLCPGYGQKSGIRRIQRNSAVCQFHARPSVDHVPCRLRKS
jgi:hypothetical protein